MAASSHPLIGASEGLVPLCGSVGSVVQFRSLPGAKCFGVAAVTLYADVPEIAGG